MSKNFPHFGFTALTVYAIVFLVAAINFVNAQSTDDEEMIARAEKISGDKFTFSAKTPQGANVFAVNNPSGELLQAIDRGLTELFDVARKNNYRRRLDYSDYTIFVARADRATDRGGNYLPALAVSSAQYAGSAYDQGGFIYVAGMVVSVKPAAFIISEHEREFKQVSDVVRYEGEHIVLYHNDRRRYKKTADHSRGGGHPILN